jgi:hypothetical protein
MHLRPLLLSVAVLAPLAAAVWWFQRPEPPPSLNSARIGQRLAEPDALARADRVELKLGAASIAFARSTDQRWFIEGSPALPADLSKLSRLASDLVATRIERLVTSNPDRIATLGLDETSIAYFDADRAPLIRLDLGRTAESGGRFLRYPGDPGAYLARLSTHLDPTPESWRDTALLPGIQSSDLASIRISFPDTNETLVASRASAADPWTAENLPEGRRLKSSALNGHATTLAGLNYTSVVPKIDPAAAAARVFPRPFVLTTFDGREIKLEFQRVPAPPSTSDDAAPTPPQPRPVYVELTDGAGDSLLAAAGRTHAFEVAEWIFNGLPIKLDDLLEDAAP